jgi:hypothetical protein
MENPLSVRIQGKLHSTVHPASGEALFPLYYIKHAQDLQGLSCAQSARAGHRHSQSAPLPCPARTGPAGTLPCPARPCWSPSQPVSPSPVPSTHRTCRDSPVPSPPLLATITASQPLSSFCRAGPGRPDLHTRAPSRTDYVNLIYKFITCVHLSDTTFHHILHR